MELQAKAVCLLELLRARDSEANASNKRTVSRIDMSDSTRQHRILYKRFRGRPVSFGDKRFDIIVAQAFLSMSAVQPQSSPKYDL